MPAFAAEYANLLYPIKNAEAFNQGTLLDPSALGLSSIAKQSIGCSMGRDHLRLMRNSELGQQL